MNGNGKGYAIPYARYSPRPEKKDAKGRVRECPSNEVQIAEIREWCAGEGLEIREPPFVVAALSGATDLEDNPTLWAALISLKRGDTLVVYALDRLARSLLNQLLFIREAERKGAKVRSLAGEGTDDDSYDGRMVRNIVGSVNERNREASAARTKAYMLYHQANGLRVCGRGSNGIQRVPYGTRIDPNDDARIVPNEDELAVVKRVWLLRDTGLGARSIARALTAEGYAPRSSRWHPKLISRILARPRVG